MRSIFEWFVQVDSATVLARELRRRGRADQARQARRQGPPLQAARSHGSDHRLRAGLDGAPGRERARDRGAAAGERRLRHTAGRNSHGSSHGSLHRSREWAQPQRRRALRRAGKAVLRSERPMRGMPSDMRGTSRRWSTSSRAGRAVFGRSPGSRTLAACCPSRRPLARLDGHESAEPARPQGGSMHQSLADCRWSRRSRTSSWGCFSPWRRRSSSSRSSGSRRRSGRTCGWLSSSRSCRSDEVSS